MAYPFSKAPTVEEFVRGLVEKYGCQLHTLDGDIVLVGPRGPVSIKYLTRNEGDQELISEPLPEHIGDCLCPDSARRLIVQLKLPKEAWLWAGDPYALPDDGWAEGDEKPE